MQTRNAGNATPATAISKVDERSERVIATLLPEVRPITRRLVQKAGRARDRHQGDQRLPQLRRAGRPYAQGRTAPAPK